MKRKNQQLLENNFINPDGTVNISAMVEFSLALDIFKEHGVLVYRGADGRWRIHES